MQVSFSSYNKHNILSFKVWPLSIGFLLLKLASFPKQEPLIFYQDIYVAVELWYQEPNRGIELWFSDLYTDFCLIPIPPFVSIPSPKSLSVGNPQASAFVWERGSFLTMRTREGYDGEIALYIGFHFILFTALPFNLASGILSTSYFLCNLSIF